MCAKLKKPEEKYLFLLKSDFAEIEGTDSLKPSDDEEALEFARRILLSEEEYYSYIRGRSAVLTDGEGIVVAKVVGTLTVQTETKIKVVED